MFTLAISCFAHFQFALIHEPNISGSYAILLFTSITSHIHSWVLVLPWLHFFTLSGVISPLISSSILGTYRPGEFPFQYPIIFPFHTVHGFRKGRGTRDQIANIGWIIEKAREFQRNIFCLMDYTKAFDCVDQNKLENS